MVTLPVPRDVLGKLGGPAALGERLRPIMAAGLGPLGQLSPGASDQLASAYDALFQQLTVVPAEQPAGAGADDPGNPVEVDPRKGRSLTLPVPEQVLGRLGGAPEVGERLAPILGAAPGAGGPLSPEASDKLASAYSEVIRHLSAATPSEGQHSQGQPSPGQHSEEGR